MKLKAIKKLSLERKAILDSEELSALVKIESAICSGFRNYCEKEGFI